MATYHKYIYYVQPDRRIHGWVGGVVSWALSLFNSARFTGTLDVLSEIRTGVERSRLSHWHGSHIPAAVAQNPGTPLIKSSTLEFGSMVFSTGRLL